jgi:hypothetical protein
LFTFLGSEINLELEENLIAIGANVRRETGKDVFESDPQLNEWMQRVKKLGGAAETEDDERSKRLEEVNNAPTKTILISQEIMAQRKARKERREGISWVWSVLICRTEKIIVAFKGLAEEYCFRATEPCTFNSIKGCKG